MGKRRTKLKTFLFDTIDEQRQYASTHREANTSYPIVQSSLSLPMNRVGRILK